MGQQPAILGFRQDRVGARLIGIINILRLREILDPKARFAWLGQPDGPYPDLADPAQIFQPDFIADLMLVVPQNPDMTGRRSLTAAASGMRRAAMAEALANGDRWFCDAAFDLATFQDERLPAVADRAVQIADALPFSDTLTAARDRVLVRLGGADGARPMAVHIRRGDILDGDPWSYTAWPSKYVPDEYFRAYLADMDGPVLAFSDTPAAIGHATRGDPRVHPVASLLAAEDGLTRAQRDVLELLLMAHCARVGAPSFSAFSRAAHVLGGTAIAALPNGLPRPARTAAHDALLDRVIGAHDSFFAPGDLAQSLHYAAPHAITTGRGADLLAAFLPQQDFLDRFPFVKAALAMVALNEGRADDAARLGARMLANPRLRGRDRINAHQIALLGAVDPVDASGAASDPATDREAGYLTELFVGRRSGGVALPRLGWAVLTRKGRAGQALLLGPAAARQMIATDAARQAANELPPWIPQLGWTDLIENPDTVRRLREWPALQAKLAPVAPLLGAVEAALISGDTPPAVSRVESELLGCAASALILDNRLMRAMRLLEWLADRRRGDAMARKRLSDACFAAGNSRAGWRWLTAAHEAAPENPLICLSAALRSADGAAKTEASRPPSAAEWLTRAEAGWPGLPLTARIARRLRGAG